MAHQHTDQQQFKTMQAGVENNKVKLKKDHSIVEENKRSTASHTSSTKEEESKKHPEINSSPRSKRDTKEELKKKRK